jgi:hypothetical protein
VKYWLGEIAAAGKREKDFRKEGKRILEIYSGKKKDSIPFNILYSNTETLMPALYSAQPRPVVQRRFKDADPLGKASSMAGQRLAGIRRGHKQRGIQLSFDDVMADAVLDALLPGRGASREPATTLTSWGLRTARYVKSELVCFDSLKWDRCDSRLREEVEARVPWLAFEHDVTVEEAERLFGKAKADKLQFSTEKRTPPRTGKTTTTTTDKTDEDIKVAKVWEIWVREGKKVLLRLPELYRGPISRKTTDPLGLTGFFPLPEPLRFLRKANDLLANATVLPLREPGKGAQPAQRQDQPNRGCSSRFAASTMER